MKYKKKPVVIEAFQYNGNLKGSNGAYCVPDWAVQAFNNDVLFYKDDWELYVETLEGDMHANVGDYIIKGVGGELYPCKPDIFEQTYEPFCGMQEL